MKIVVLDRRRQQGVTLYGRGREIEEMEKALEFDGGSWTVLGDASDVRRKVLLIVW